MLIRIEKTRRVLYTNCDTMIHFNTSKLISKSSRIIISYLLPLSISFTSCNKNTDSLSIDRAALVARHTIALTAIDTLGSLSVGNGEFAFTVDASGLQSFPENYENGIALGTQSQWGWHNFTGARYSLNDVASIYASCDSTKVPYAIQHATGSAGAATKWLRTNPHRLHLGLVGLVLIKENGDEVNLSELQNIHQQLDLWSGKIESAYDIEGIPVNVQLYAHQQQDLISAKITSPLISKKRLKIRFKFPYGNECHVCPGYDWDHPEKHKTELKMLSIDRGQFTRHLDSTVYYADIGWKNTGSLSATSTPHEFELNPSENENSFEFSIRFSEKAMDDAAPLFSSTQKNSTEYWKEFWMQGGAVDFSNCTDARAFELERRVVLSQYLTRIQCAGSLPPQETGLTMNSWYGKFHLEMHWWHSMHFMLWARPSLLEKSMPWYASVIDKAKAAARVQGYEGARWQKMTDPYGNESPSSVGVFLIWQQPHPIYYAELFYRESPTKQTLEKYKDIVFNTADFMASYACYSEQDKKYHLGPPVIPAQEIFKAKETLDPAFELAYWHWGLSTALKWQERMGQDKNKKWQHVLDNLAPLPHNDNLYLPVASVPAAYTDDAYRKDHPAVLATFGVLPSSHDLDTSMLARTFNEIMKNWNWETTWGWDYPMIAMTAARLGKPEKAIDALLMNVQKNTCLVNGHNYQDKRLRLYLPGNGGLLAAIAMMAAGWDGNTVKNPGFPKDGNWDVRWEGLRVMP